jgi:steroid 5-alpha reductase family enzyme
MAAKAADYRAIIIAYAVTLVAGALALYGLPLHAPYDALAADLVATVVIFGFSLGYRNSSFYDAYWSVIPPLLAFHWYATAPADIDPLRALCVLVLVCLWAIRLTANWALHWGGLGHEDWRYPLVRQKAGRFAVAADFAGIHLFPTLQVFLGCLPVYAVMSLGTAPFGPLDLLAAAVTLGAILIETLADRQLHAFAARRTPGSFIQDGLWAWSRHPNYFGELSFWWGMMLFGLAAAPAAWPWVIPGALAMTLMFCFASIPLMEQRSLARRPGYADYQRRVSALLPLPPRRRP